MHATEERPVDKDTKALAEVLSRWVNTHGMIQDFDSLIAEMLQDHHTLVQLKAKLFIRFFEVFADVDERFVDGRNEASYKFAKALVAEFKRPGGPFDRWTGYKGNVHFPFI